MYTIPLRRALVTNSDLPYPEGVAAAEVLKVGSGSRGNAHDDADAAANSRGPACRRLGSIASAVFYLFTQTGIAAQEAAAYFRVGNAATGMGVGLSLALVGAGHLVGLSVGIAMLAGLVIAWGIATPVLTSLHPAAATLAAADVAVDVWRTRCVSSAPARSASRRSGRWAS